MKYDTPEKGTAEHACFEAWWRGLTKEGDPAYRPFLVSEAFKAGWRYAQAERAARNPKATP